MRTTRAIPTTIPPIIPTTMTQTGGFAFDVGAAGCPVGVLSDVGGLHCWALCIVHCLFLGIPCLVHSLITLSFPSPQQYEHAWQSWEAFSK